MDTTLTTDCTANENNIYNEKSKMEILCTQNTIHFTLTKTNFRVENNLKQIYMLR
jgi:hypothetical protein